MTVVTVQIYKAFLEHNVTDLSTTDLFSNSCLATLIPGLYQGITKSLQKNA